MEEKQISVTEIEIDRREEWNDFLAQHPYFVLMQAWEWGEFKKLSGWIPYRLAVEREGKIIACAQMLIKPVPSGVSSLIYVPRGPVLDWDDEAVTSALLEGMHHVAREYRAITLKIEPATPYSDSLQQRLQNYGFVESDFDNNPRSSLLIDLTAEPDELLARMGKTTRYNIRYSARRGVSVREAKEKDLDIYYDIMDYNARKAGVPARLKSHYDQEWLSLAPRNLLKVFLAVYEGQVIAMRVPALFGTTAATFYSGFFDPYRRLKPSELLMWESMMWAKSEGCTTYDVWGIPDEMGQHVFQDKPLPEKQKGGLWGVYEFKRSFGGEVIYYIGTYDYVYSPFLFSAMNTAISLSSLDKLGRLGDFIKFW